MTVGRWVAAGAVAAAPAAAIAAGLWFAGGSAAAEPQPPLVQSMGGHTVVVTPYREGPATVVVSGKRRPEASLDGNPLELAATAAGWIADVDLDDAGTLTLDGNKVLLTPAGSAEGGDTLPVTLPAGEPGAECGSWLLGHVAAARAAGTDVVVQGVDGGADTCSPVPDAARVAGVAVAELLQGRGLRSAEVVGDGTARADEFADGIRSVLPPAKGGPAAAVVVATGADAASRVVADADGSRPVVLAPWLLEADLLDDATNPVAVASALDPGSPTAHDYLHSLSELHVTDGPNAAGLVGWLAATGADLPSDGVELYVPSSGSVLPEMFHPGHEEHGGHHESWLTGARLVAVT